MTERIYRFAEFELNLARGELRAGESVIRLQEKPLLLLAALLDHSQQLVTREELRGRMWNSRTVVDYEQGINVAMRKLREALGDSVEHPRFIETLARKGYRFLVPVEVADREASSPAIAVASQTAAASDLRENIPAIPVRRRWRVWAFAAAAAGIGLGILAFQSRPQGPTHIRSLAVLPLQNLSPDPGQEYFADGITEDLITSLAQTLPLRVISRTSVMRYKRTDKPVQQIAKELGVEAIVEGSVARSGNRLNVTVQLIDATEDRHLWAEKYERRIEDIMAIESELSEAIANQVSDTLNLRRAAARVTRSVDPQVYELCLLGRFHLNKRTTADLLKSAEYFRRAIALDPTYAPAHAGKADVYALLPHHGTTRIQESFAEAVVAARRALQLDDSLAEPHATLGLIALQKYPDWMQAGSEFRRALALNPNYARAHHWYAFYLFFSGRHNEALAEMELARQGDPLSAITNADYGAFLYAVRRHDEAKARLRQAIELAPDLGQPHMTLALIALETGNAAAALEEARTGLRLDPGNSRTMGEAGYVFAVTGNTAEATKLLSTLEELVSRDAAFPAFLALVEIGLGKKERALEILEQMREQTVSSGIGHGLRGLEQWHGFDALSTEPRYLQMLADPAPTSQPAATGEAMQVRQRL